MASETDKMEGSDSMGRPDKMGVPDKMGAPHGAGDGAEWDEQDGMSARDTMGDEPSEKK